LGTQAKAQGTDGPSKAESGGSDSGMKKAREHETKIHNRRNGARARTRTAKERNAV